jgi:rhamnogalacturonan endolyase
MIRFGLGTLMVVLLSCGALAEEKLDRALVAVQRDDGKVLLSWRMLKGDASDAAYEIRRTSGDAKESEAVLITDKPCTASCFVDAGVKVGQRYTYRLFTAGSDKTLNTATVELFEEARPYVRVKLSGDYDIKRVGVGDLDGDGAYEYIIQQPDFNTDPYQKPGYWKKSTTTYKIEAYRLDGTMLWRYDQGWSIEAGTWYAPWVVYDLDGDGRAEVYAKAGVGDPRDEKGQVTTGPEYLVKLDGMTGKIVAQCDWLTRDGFDEYNYYQRNMLGVAYLDGKSPSLIVQRGTYKLIKIAAVDKDLKQQWYWESTGENKKYSGQGSHGTVAADIDFDGRDELVIGGAVLDEYGKGLWTLGMGHPDMVYVADIDPAHPGLEIFYGFENKQKTGGLSVVDALTGTFLWKHDQPTSHIHSQGMAADILPEYPGMEVYAGERDTPDRWLYSAQGKLIEHRVKGDLSIRALWWDDDEFKEVGDDGIVKKWNGPALSRTETDRVIAVMDCLGDWREELIGWEKGELRVFSTPLPSKTSKPCLMQDRQYRLGVASQTSGYYYPAQMGTVAK